MSEFVLHLRGLPYSSTEQTIADFMGVDQERLTNITIARLPDGRHSGEAYIAAGDQETAEQCLLQHKQTMPGTHRYRTFWNCVNPENGSLKSQMVTTI